MNSELQKVVTLGKLSFSEMAYTQVNAKLSFLVSEDKEITGIARERQKGVHQKLKKGKNKTRD